MLKKYRCHQKVQAFQIEHILKTKEGVEGPETLLIGSEVNARVSQAWMDKHGPIEVGGYYLLYEEGLPSYCSEKVFVEGFKLIPGRSKKDVPVK